MAHDNRSPAIPHLGHPSIHEFRTSSSVLRYLRKVCCVDVHLPATVDRGKPSNRTRKRWVINSLFHTMVYATCAALESRIEQPLALPLSHRHRVCTPTFEDFLDHEQAARCWRLEHDCCWDGPHPDLTWKPVVRSITGIRLQTDQTDQTVLLRCCMYYVRLGPCLVNGI